MPLRGLAGPVLAGLMVLAGPMAPARAGVTPEEEARILATIRGRVQRFLANHRGIAARRWTVVREYDPDDGRLVKTAVYDADQIDYFYSKPAIRILRCFIDGRRVDNEQCDSDRQRREPHLQLFDGDGKRNYAVRITGEVTIKGQRAYRLDVRARRKTDRHFVGQLYFRASDLQLLFLEGSVARLPFPVRHLYLKLHFRKYGQDLVGVSRGYVDIWVRVPLVFKRRIVTRFTASGHRAVRKRP
jgi:hypothetical protein